MHSYIAARQANPDADARQQWLGLVVDRRWAEWAAGQFNEGRTRDQLSSPVTDLEALNSCLELVSAAPLSEIIARTCAEIDRHLPLPFDRAVCIWVDPRIGRDEHGVVGTCVGDNILLQINPFGDWLDYVPYVLAHESHHSYWGYRHFGVKQRQRYDFGTLLVTEGEADSFAKTLFPDIDVPWIKALTPEQEREQWPVMQAALSSPDPATYTRFMFGDAPAGTPRYTGYTIGFRLVQAYLGRHPELSVAEWTERDPEEIIPESGYGSGS